MAMTCRIDRLATEDDGVILRVSGRCVGRALDVLRDALAEGHRVRTIDLKDVRQVDRDAVKLLAISKTSGVELKNCPAFIQEWIARARAEPDPHLPSDGRDR
jgi:hypothetical protein